MNELLIADIYESEKYAILDVDRTIINGTAWFRACATPDLLISKEERGVIGVVGTSEGVNSIK